MEFSKNTLEGLDWHGRLQFLSDCIFPKYLQWDLYRELEVFFLQVSIYLQNPNFVFPDI